MSNLFASRLPRFPGDSFSRCNLLLTILFLVASAATAAEQRSSHSLENYLKRLGYEPIPLKRDHGNHLFLYGEIGGKSHRIAVDTGCSVTRIDRTAARKLKTLGQVGVELEDSFLGRITNAGVHLLHVKLGSAVFTNQPAWTETLDARGDVVGDCILGCDFLFRNFCLIDCLNQKLYVRGTEPPVKAEQALEESLRVSGFHEIKLLQTSALVMTVAGKADGEPIKLLLDTGAPWLLLDSKQEYRLHIERRVTGAHVDGIGKVGSAHLYRTQLESLELGDLSLKYVDVGIADLSGWKIGDSKLPLRDVDGILGADLLADNRALIDYNGLKLWLQGKPVTPSAKATAP